MCLLLQDLLQSCSRGERLGMVKEVLVRGRNYAVVTGGDSVVAQVRQGSEPVADTDAW